MPARRSDPRPAPRELADLPYAEYLEPFDGGGRLERERTYDTVRFDGDEFEDADGGGAGFTESAFTSVVFTGGRYRRARFNDVWLHTVRWVGTDLAETDWMDAETVSGAFAGVEVFGAVMRRTTFFNCKFDSVNARAATLRDVRFVDCLLRDVDFGDASLTGVTFPGSVLDGVRLEKARMAEVDLRDAAGLGIAAGHDALRGAIVSGAQLLDLAPALARVLGIEVRDR
ncbi:pentapeptide repeat-containing protein [Streptomyces sp. DH37]|uniref:pentapeptide repeat-containing protein n=1 Tax=Streptomyces sp. DH37 TaxID=3040122 RepID=UPI0024435E5E|nr:pentapeptide repeat-containing protein [Streptomyces sp. DH37]MDG9705439.1 pentapeptide repeat-containing protein [Streptomyces sp. DH37]